MSEQVQALTTLPTKHVVKRMAKRSVVALAAAGTLFAVTYAITHKAAEAGKEETTQA